MSGGCVLTTKRIVCLANSFRPGGSCVAGIELVDGGFGPWVRPISHRANEAINDEEQTCTDGTRLSVLDIVEIDFDDHRPEGHQTENWLITEGARWRKVGRLEAEELAGAVVPANAPLWGPATGTYNGTRDQVHRVSAEKLNSSLTLIRPRRASIEVLYNPFKEKNQLWVSFKWSDVRHKILLTDPVQFARYDTQAGDVHDIQKPFMCISLAKVWEASGHASKLVAGIVT
ncbi:dual OB domain-containing protein [Histidinibacterium aquaticum]|uniref:dual OB domain-containing protein n=1 Tax=Histidinibacterium aquaticum TaxID=2613962 RepID=UPI0037C0F83A